MRVLVVYESMFGNTHTIAEAIADGLAPYCMVETIEVSNAPADLSNTFDLVIAGGPTHQFGMSRASSRKEAAKQADRALVSRGIGIREWLETVTFDGPVAAAAFDTRMSSPRWLHYVGSAAGKIQRKMKRLGFTVAGPAEHFHVTGLKGPLVDGEIGRARAWGAALATGIAAPVPGYQTA